MLIAENPFANSLKRIRLQKPHGIKVTLESPRTHIETRTRRRKAREAKRNFQNSKQHCVYRRTGKKTRKRIESRENGNLNDRGDEPVELSALSSVALLPLGNSFLLSGFFAAGTYYHCTPPRVRVTLGPEWGEQEERNRARA